MPDQTLTAADLAFYEWMHANAEEYGSYSWTRVREMFMAGWTAAMAGQSGE